MSRTVAPSTKRTPRRARIVAEEVLEDAAVELVARRRQEAAGAELGDVRRCRAAPSREEEAEAELLQLRSLAGAARGRAPCRSSARRSRPTTRRPCARPAAPDGGAARAPGRRCPAKRLRSCSASVRPARPPPRIARRRADARIRLPFHGPSGRRSVHRAVDRDDLAADVAGLRRREKGDQRGDFGGACRHASSAPSARSSPASKPAAMPASMMPGATALTVMPRLATSSASAFVALLIAPLAAA